MKKFILFTIMTALMATVMVGGEQIKLSSTRYESNEQPSPLFSYVQENQSSSDHELDGIRDWALRQMRSWAPYVKGARSSLEETKQEWEERYRDIVDSAIAVAFDRSEDPLFKGPDGRSRTLALLLSIAHHESNFRKDVDLGVSPHGRGDSGRSWCLVQIQLSNPDPTSGTTPIRIVLDGPSWKYAFDSSTGWGGPDLVGDHMKCFRAGLHMARVSFRACSHLPVVERLSVYTSGGCNGTLGRKTSRERVGTAISWLFRDPSPGQDETVLAAFETSRTGSIQPDFVE